MEKIAVTRILFGCSIIWLIGWLAVAPTNADEFTVNLKSGSVITVETRDPTITWTDVLSNGELQQRTIPVSEIRELALSGQSGSKQVSLIRQYLTQLSSRDYLERETAEGHLADSKIAGRFRSLVKSESAHPNLEVRTRIARILEKLQVTNVETGEDFDLLVLNDGSQIRGDVGELKLDCEYRDQQLSFSRAEIHSLTTPKKTAAVEVNAKPVSIEVFQQPDEIFFRPEQTTIEFEKAPNGQELTRNSDVSEMFVPLGLLLASEKPGFVGVSGYGFKFPMPPRENSVCVFESSGTTSKRFKGVMEFRFCLPNQRSVMGGVREFGLFMARVDQPRDFILEAFNAEGQILATVEASDAKCVFLGIRSSEPITFARLSSNPYLFSIHRKIDEDYAIDNVCFSPPVPVPGLRESQAGLLRLQNGDLLQGQAIRFAGNQVSINLSELNSDIVVPLDTLHNIRFESQATPLVAGQRNWFAMLTDRSVIKVDPIQNFRSELFGGRSISREEISALWFANNKIRFPCRGDFELGQSVLVFPTCRIAIADLELQSGRIIWTVDKKLEQNLWIENEGSGRNDTTYEDPTPNLQQVDFADTSPELIPTLWLREPPPRRTETGLIRLADGQQLVLGGANRFAIKEIQPDSVLVVDRSGQVETIPLTKISAIDFPLQ